MAKPKILLELEVDKEGRKYILGTERGC